MANHRYTRSVSPENNHSDPTADVPQNPGGEPLRVPERIGGHRIKRLIGRGGMGVVYEAYDENLGRPVALKLIQTELASQEMRRRFLQERETLARMQHPSIAHIYGGGEFEQDGVVHPFFTMEYIVGAKPITGFFRDSGVDIAVVLRTFEGLFDALEHAHQRGIVHRDIKPGNILVDDEGRARIIDFGLSLPRGTRGASDSISAEAGLPAGTPAYMSPEQRRGDQYALKGTTDIYSLALVLYEVLAGRRPEPHSNLDLRRDAPSMPGALADVLETALAENPSDRIPAGVVRDALRACREGLFIESTVRVDINRPSVRAGLAGWVLAAVAASIGAFLIPPLCCHMLPLCNQYARLAAALISQPDNPFGGVRIVAIDEKTLASEAVAGRGNPPVGVLDLRARHPEIMDRLVRGSARAIVWDLYFRSRTEHDGAFAESLGRAIESRTPTLLMTRSWAIGGGAPPISPALAASGATVACGTGRFTADIPWHVDLAARRGDGFIRPGLALATVSLLQPAELDHASARLDVEFDTENMSISVRPWVIGPEGDKQQIGPSRVFGVTGFTHPGVMGFAVGLAPDDEVAQQMLTIPDDDVLGRFTVRYEDVLRMSVDELHDEFSDQIVVIGGVGPSFRDLRPLAGGRMVAGCYAHAAAIDTLLGANSISTVSDTQLMTLSALAGAIGAAVMFGGRRLSRRLPLLAVLPAVTVLGCLVALRWRTVIYPSPPALAFIAGGLIGAVGWSVVQKWASAGRTATRAGM